MGAIEDLFEAFADGNFGAALPLLDEHVVLVIDDSVPDSGRYLGPEGVRDYMAQFLEPWERLTISAVSVEQDGDTFLVTAHQEGTGRGSGVPATFDYFQLWTFRGGKAIRIDVVNDEARARAMITPDG